MATEAIHIAVRLRPKAAHEESRQEVVVIDEVGARQEGKVCISDGENYLEGRFEKLYGPEVGVQEVL